MKKTLSFLALALLSLAGCVSIYDSKVQVRPPEQVDTYNRNVLDQCTPHVYPHRLIQATTGAGYPYLNTGGALVSDQDQFDKWWAGLSAQIDQNKVMSDNQKPVIDWNQQTAYFVPLNASSACQHFKPYGDEMSTDCYNITIPILALRDGDCQQAPSSFQVFVYIYPKATNQPVAIQWINPTPQPTATLTPLPTPTPTRTPTPEPDEED